MVVCFTILCALVGDTRLYSRGSIYVYSDYKLKTDKKKKTYPFQWVNKLVIQFISIIYAVHGIKLRIPEF